MHCCSSRGSWKWCNFWTLLWLYSVFRCCRISAWTSIDGLSDSSSQKGHYYSSLLLFRLHLWGEELYTKMVFFVQTISADRYIHRREMWVLSLKSSSSVEFEIKKIFVFFEELSKLKVLCEHVVFCSLLPWFYSI